MAAVDPRPHLQLVLGPARSGKSRWAEHLAGVTGVPVTYVATAPSRPADGAWQERLERHRRRRPAAWSTLEISEPGMLPEALATLPPTGVTLIDSLGSWVAGSLALPSSGWQAHCDALLAGVDRITGSLIIVSEQTGWGVVPPTAIGGLFRDRLGMIERQLVARAHTAWLVVAGRALNLTLLGQTVPAD